MDNDTLSNYWHDVSPILKLGHFNLYNDEKVVMSFWSYTGKCYIPSMKFSDNIGIHDCVKKYRKLFVK